MLTKIQKTRLTKAVLNATGFGECDYTVRDHNDKATAKPQCVIGQLFKLEGASARDLFARGDKCGSVSSLASGYDSSDWPLDVTPLESRVLAEYGTEFLSDLQMLWDGMRPQIQTEDDARLAMLFLVEAES